MPRYEGFVACLKEDGKAEVIIGPDNTGVPGASSRINRRVCHCVTDGSTLRIEALNKVGAGVGDRVYVSRNTSVLAKNAAALIGVPGVCLMLGIALAAILMHGFVFPVIAGIAVAAGFLLAGIVLGAFLFRRISTGSLPAIDSIIKTCLETASMNDEDGCPMQSDRRSCTGCAGSFT